MSTSNLAGRSDSHDTEVAIIGAGPVGCALAVDLAASGIETVVLEARGRDERPHPGTNLTNARSMEHVRRWGATEHLLTSNPLGPRWARDVVFPAHVDGPEIVRMTGSLGFADGLPFSPARPRFGPQESIERGFRARLAELPSGEIRFDCTFEKFVEHDDRVEVVYRDDAGAELSLSAKYLVGCDGSRSLVRRQLGIRMEGKRAIQSATIWYIHSPQLRDLITEHLGGAAFCWFVNEQGTNVEILAQDDEGLFQFFDGPLDESTDGNDWEAMKRRLLDAVGREIDVEPVEGGAFKINSLVAPQFHRGRVFLAGESAHHISVFGGFGMNTGIGDVADIGWKLAAAVHGWAGPELLASYDAERIPVVKWIRDLTEASTFHTPESWSRPGMEADGPEGDAVREQVAQMINSVKAQEVMSFGAQFGAAYFDSPIIVSDGTRPPTASFGDYTPSASPGARAPHVWLRDGSSLLDHVALEGFTLFQLDEAVDPQAFLDAAAERGVPLALVTPPEPLSEIRDLYEATLVLVRPDHYVAWRGAAVPHDPGAVIDVVRGLGRHRQDGSGSESSVSESRAPTLSARA